MTRQWTICGILILMGTFLGCGDKGRILEVFDVVGIPQGDKEGTGLSGDFAVTVEYRKNDCSEDAALEVPGGGQAAATVFTVEQDGGQIRFIGPEGTTARGGIDFENRYEAGTSDTISRDGDLNIQRYLFMEGSFLDSNRFNGKGNVRLQGRIGDREIDCTYTFTHEAVRQ